jgi:hypothetical protein
MFEHDPRVEPGGVLFGKSVSTLGSSPKEPEGDVLKASVTSAFGELALPGAIRFPPIPERVSGASWCLRDDGFV